MWHFSRTYIINFRFKLMKYAFFESSGPILSLELKDNIDTFLTGRLGLCTPSILLADRFDSFKRRSTKSDVKDSSNEAFLDGILPGYAAFVPGSIDFRVGTVGPSTFVNFDLDAISVDPLCCK